MHARPCARAHDPGEEGRRTSTRAHRLAGWGPRAACSASTILSNWDGSMSLGLRARNFQALSICNPPVGSAPVSGAQGGRRLPASPPLRDATGVTVPREE